MTHGENQHSFKQKIEIVVLKRGVGKPELGGLSSYVQFKRIYDKFRKNRSNRQKQDQKSCSFHDHMSHMSCWKIKKTISEILLQKNNLEKLKFYFKFFSLLGPKNIVKKLIFIEETCKLVTCKIGRNLFKIHNVASLNAFWFLNVVKSFYPFNLLQTVRKRRKSSRVLFSHK